MLELVVLTCAVYVTAARLAWRAARWVWRRAAAAAEPEWEIRVVTDPDEQRARRAAWDELDEIDRRHLGAG